MKTYAEISNNKDVKSLVNKLTKNFEIHLSKNNCISLQNVESEAFYLLQCAYYSNSENALSCLMTFYDAVASSLYSCIDCKIKESFNNMHRALDMFCNFASDIGLINELSNGAPYAKTEIELSEERGACDTYIIKKGAEQIAEKFVQKKMQNKTCYIVGVLSGGARVAFSVAYYMKKLSKKRPSVEILRVSTYRRTNNSLQPYTKKPLLVVGDNIIYRLKQVSSNILIVDENYTSGRTLNFADKYIRSTAVPTKVYLAAVIDDTSVSFTFKTVIPFTSSELKEHMVYIPKFII